MNGLVTQPIPGRQARPSLLAQNHLPAWDEAAEQAVLGGIILVPGILQTVTEILRPEDFYLSSHRVIFAAILRLREREAPIDVIMLADQVAGASDVGQRGGRSYLHALLDVAGPGTNAPHHARIVKELSRKRQADDICLAALENQLSVGEALALLADLDESTSSDALPVIDAITFCQQTPEEPDWIFDGYVARGAITELGARIKTGKTHFTTDLIRAVLAGEKYLGRKTSRTGVLYLTEERTTSFRRALTRVGLTEAAGLHITFRHEVKSSWPEVARAVITKASALGIGLVVVDTLSVWSGIETDKENDAGAAMAAMRPAEDMAAADLAVLALRHERKSGGEVGESTRGSSAFGGAADILLSLKKEQAPGHDNRRLLEAVGRLEGWEPRLVLEMESDHYRSLGTSAQVEHEKARETLLGLLPDDLEDALPEKDLLAQAPEQTSRSTLKRALGELVAQGVARKQKGAGTASSKAYGFWKTGGGS